MPAFSVTQRVRPVTRSRARTGGLRPLVALLVVVVVAGASLTFGLYGPTHLARPDPAGTPAVQGTDHGQNPSLSSRPPRPA